MALDHTLRPALQCIMADKTGLQDAIEAAGGASALADQLGVTYQAIWYWMRDGKVPIARVVEVERITGVPRERLRPDFFGAPRPRPLRRQAEAAA